jgi:hypothetical protein
MEPYILLTGLLASHFLCDYIPLSTSIMLSAKRIGKPLGPIFNHALVHMIGVLVVLGIALQFTHISAVVAIICLLVELSTHFIIDVLKGRCNTWFPVVANPANKSHWVIFGFDQLLHQLVMLLICYIILN